MTAALADLNARLIALKLPALDAAALADLNTRLIALKLPALDAAALPETLTVERLQHALAKAEQRDAGARQFLLRQLAGQTRCRAGASCLRVANSKAGSTARLTPATLGRVCGETSSAPTTCGNGRPIFS